MSKRRPLEAARPDVPYSVWTRDIIKRKSVPVDLRRAGYRSFMLYYNTSFTHLPCPHLHPSQTATLLLPFVVTVLNHAHDAVPAICPPTYLLSLVELRTQGAFTAICESRALCPHPPPSATITDSYHNNNNDTYNKREEESLWDMEQEMVSFDA